VACGVGSGESVLTGRFVRPRRGMPLFQSFGFRTTTPVVAIDFDRAPATDLLNTCVHTLTHT
jgi:hypothetical protein